MWRGRLKRSDSADGEDSAGVDIQQNGAKYRPNLPRWSSGESSGLVTEGSVVRAHPTTVDSEVAFRRWVASADSKDTPQEVTSVQTQRLPETPREPDPEMVRCLVDDYLSKLGHEPIFGEPTGMNFGYGAMSGPPPPSSGNDGGFQWVVVGPPAGVFPGPGGPMYGAPGGFGGPGMGGPGMGGPGNFGGDMGGGMDVQGWGGPGPGPGLDYPNQNNMIGGSGQGMMGGGGRPGVVGPQGMMPMGMGILGHGPGNYGEPHCVPVLGLVPKTHTPTNQPLCKHYMNGHCRYDKKCKFSHDKKRKSRN